MLSPDTGSNMGCSGTINIFTAPSRIFVSALQPVFLITSLTVHSAHLSPMPWTSTLAMQSVWIHHSRFSASPSKFDSLGTTVNIQKSLCQGHCPNNVEHTMRLDRLSLTEYV